MLQSRHVFTPYGVHSVLGEDQSYCIYVVFSDKLTVFKKTEDCSMKIVALDGYCENPGDLSWGWLEKLGDLTVHDRTPHDNGESARRIGAAEIVLTFKTHISAEVLAQCPQVRFVAVTGTGYDMVDVAAAKERGIPVSTVPSYGSAIVGQFAIALLLEVCHRVGHHDHAVKTGCWEKCPDWCFWDYPQLELAGKTMGIIGFGRIGQVTGAVARVLGMRVLAAGSRPTDTGREIAEYVDMDTLLLQSDVISLHCPLFPSTRNIICRENIEKMKDGVIIINNSRGGLVVEQDLADALNSGKVYAAAVDVVSSEPIKGDNPLLTAKNCIITPHIAWATKEARQRIMSTTEENVRAYLRGTPQHVVNG